MRDLLIFTKDTIYNVITIDKTHMYERPYVHSAHGSGVRMSRFVWVLKVKFNFFLYIFHPLCAWSVAGHSPISSRRKTDRADLGWRENRLYCQSRSFAICYMFETQTKSLWCDYGYYNRIVSDQIWIWNMVWSIKIKNQLVFFED